MIFRTDLIYLVALNTNKYPRLQKLYLLPGTLVINFVPNNSWWISNKYFRPSQEKSELLTSFLIPPPILSKSCPFHDLVLQLSKIRIRSWHPFIISSIGFLLYFKKKKNSNLLPWFAKDTVWSGPFLSLWNYLIIPFSGPLHFSYIDLLCNFKSDVFLNFLRLSPAQRDWL